MPEKAIQRTASPHGLTTDQIKDIYTTEREKIVADELKCVADIILTYDPKLRKRLDDSDFIKMARQFDLSLNDISVGHMTLTQIREGVIWDYISRNPALQKPLFRRICIQRSGYAIVQGDTWEETLENAKQLKANDFDWEDVRPDMIEATADIVETCNENGETVNL